MVFEDPGVPFRTGTLCKRGGSLSGFRRPWVSGTRGTSPWRAEAAAGSSEGFGECIKCVRSSFDLDCVREPLWISSDNENTMFCRVVIDSFFFATVAHTCRCCARERFFFPVLFFLDNIYVELYICPCLQKIFARVTSRKCFFFVFFCPCLFFFSPAVQMYISHDHTPV